MSSKSYRPTGESISLFIPEYVEIPSNVFTRISRSAGDRASEELHRNVWEIAGGSYSVRVTQTEEGLDIEATRSEGGFPEQFESRLLEGLWLVLARPLEWQVRMWTRPDTDQLTITRRSAPLEHPRLLPPLMFRRRPQAAEANAVMLLTYLEYLSSYREPRFHPTSVNVRQALLASATNIETEALALGVAVESFIDREYKELCQAEGIDISELNSAVQHWEQWNGSESMKKRVLGAIQRLSGSHPRTAMNKLVASGILTPEQLSAWNKLRHTTAHGKAFDKDPRTVVRWCDMTYAALLRLIFSVIGYQGPYTDYATEGFPEIEFRGPD